MKPELEHQSAVLNEATLELDVVLSLAGEGLLPVLAPYPGNTRAVCPASDQGADLALLRQRPPVAPVPGTFTLLIGRRGKRFRADIPLVHPVADAFQNTVHGDPVVTAQ